MALMKNVNGLNVPMTAEEEADILAEWAASAEKAPEPKPITAEDLARILVAKGAITEADLALTVALSKGS